MSGVYVEDPFMRIVEVVWKKKEPPDGGPPPGGEEGPCGTLSLQGSPGIANYSEGQGIHVLDSTGVWYVGRATSGSIQPDKPFGMVNAITVYGYVPPSAYVWSQPKSWTIAFGAPGPVAGLPPLYRLNVFRNINTQVFAGLDFEQYLTVAPSDRTDISSGGSLTVELQKAGEIYPPVYTVDTFERGAGIWVRLSRPGGGIHAHCKDETSNALPPQPPGYVMEGSKYPAPGSTNDPLKPAG